MKKFVFVAALFLALSACTSSENRLASARSLYEAGETAKAVKILEGGNSNDYPIGNFLAFLYERESFHGTRVGGNEAALEVLDGVELPADRLDIVNQYLALLRFSALGNAGRKEAADGVLQAFCPAALPPLGRRVCLRQQLADVMLVFRDTPGYQTRFYREFLQIAQGAYIRTYGWDPREKIPEVDSRR